MFYQHPQVLFCQAAFQSLFPQPVVLSGVIVNPSDLILGLVDPHTIGLSPSIQPIQILMQILPAHLVVICNLTEGAIDPLIQMVNTTGPSTEPWGTSLMTGHKLDPPPFTNMLWAWPSSLLTEERIHPYKP